MNSIQSIILQSFNIRLIKKRSVYNLWLHNQYIVDRYTIDIRFIAIQLTYNRFAIQFIGEIISATFFRLSGTMSEVCWTNWLTRLGAMKHLQQRGWIRWLLGQCSLHILPCLWQQFHAFNSPLSRRVVFAAQIWQSHRGNCVWQQAVIFGSGMYSENDIWCGW